MKDWDVISTDTLEQAVSDGILVRVGRCLSRKTEIPVVFTSNLFDSGGYEDATKRISLVCLVLESLKKPDAADDGYRKLRVLIPDKIWVIEDGSSITFMRPEDY